VVRFFARFAAEEGARYMERSVDANIRSGIMICPDFSADSSQVTGQMFHPNGEATMNS
jgi:hypothetical protein